MDTVIHVSLALDPNLPLGSQVYDCIKRPGIQAHFRPGDRASEMDVAKQPKVSRQPVPDAFLRLQKEGLLDIRPQRGTFIEKISIKAVLDARFLHEAIEADIVALLTQSQDKFFISTLKEQIKAQHNMPRGNPAGFMKLDEIFHRTLAEAANKCYAWQILEELKSPMDSVRFLSFQQFHIDQLITEHTSIVDAIESGSSTDAVRFIRRHLREIMQSLSTISHEYPDYFDSVNHELADTTSLIDIR